MAERNPELRIKVTASEDQAVSAIFRRLTEGYKHVKDELSVPLYLQAQLKGGDALDKSVEDLRKRAQAEADKIDIRFAAKIAAPKVAFIAAGGDASAFAAIAEEHGRAMRSAFESNLEPVANRARAMGERMASEIKSQADAAKSVFESNLPARSGIRNEDQTREALRDRFIQDQRSALKSAFESNLPSAVDRDQRQRAMEAQREQFERDKPSALKSAFESNLPAAADRDLRRQAAEAAKEAGPIRSVDRTPEEQATRDAKARILKDMSDEAAAHRTASLQIEGEVAARKEMFGLTERQARKAVNADERLAAIRNGSAAGGGNGPLGSAFADLRGMFGRYSAVAQAFQAVKAAGPLLAIGLAASEISQITSAWAKTNDAIRAGKMSAGEANDEFTRSIPLVGRIYSIIEDTREALSGEKAEVRRINDFLDYQRKSMEGAAAAAADWNKSIRDIANQSSKIGRVGESLNTENARQSRDRLIDDAQEKAAKEVEGVANPEKNKQRTELIEAAKVRNQELAEELSRIERAGDRTEPAETRKKDIRAEIEKNGREIDKARSEVSQRSLQANQKLNELTAAQQKAYADQRVQEIKDQSFDALQASLAADRERDRQSGVTHAERMRNEAQYAKDEGEQRKSIELGYKAASLNLVTEQQKQIGDRSAGFVRSIRDLFQRLDFGSVTQRVKSEYNPATLTTTQTPYTQINLPDVDKDKIIFNRMLTAGKSFWNDFIGIWSHGKEEQKKLDEENRTGLRDEDRFVEDELFRHKQRVAKIVSETAVERLRIAGQANAAERQQIQDALDEQLKAIDKEAEVKKRTHNDPDIDNRAKEEKDKARAKAQADLSQVDQQDSRYIEDEAHRHQEELKNIEASGASERLRAMGLDHEAAAVERKRDYDRQIDEVEQNLKEQLRLHADHADELGKMAREKEAAIGAGAQAKERLALIEEAKSARGALPGLNESRFGSGFALYAQEALDAGLAQHLIDKANAPSRLSPDASRLAADTSVPRDWMTAGVGLPPQSAFGDANLAFGTPQSALDSEAPDSPAQKDTAKSTAETNEKLDKLIDLFNRAFITNGVVKFVPILQQQ